MRFRNANAARGRLSLPRVVFVHALETRRLLAAVAWDAGGDHFSWTDPRNWSGDKVPTAADDVTIDTPGNPVVDVAAAAIARSLVSTQSIYIESDGTLSVGTTATLGVPMVVVGTVVGGTWEKAPGSPGGIESRGGRFQAITLDLPVKVDNSSMAFSRGAVVNDTITIIAGRIDFTGTDNQTMSGNGTIRYADPYAGAMFNWSKDPATGKGREVVIGPQILIEAHQLEMRSTETGGVIRNRGTIPVRGPGSNLTIANVINEGTLRLAEGAGLTATGLRNDGTLDITGGTLKLDGAWSNSTAITTKDTLVELGGTFPASVLGGFSRQGGTLRLVGTLDAAEGLHLNDSTGSLVLWANGVIRNGTVTTSGSAQLLPQGGALQDVTLPDDMTINGDLRVNGRLNLGGTITLAGAIRFLKDDENFLGGTGTVLLQGAHSYVYLDTWYGQQRSLTIEPGIEIAGYTGGVRASDDGGTIRNKGRITVLAPPAGSAPPEAFEVGGILESSGYHWRFINEGTITARPGSKFDLGGDWTGSPGSLVFNEASVRLGGQFNAASLDPMTRTGGTVLLRGTLDLTSGPLNLSSATGVLIVVANGYVIGPGSVESLDGTPLVSRFGTFWNVTINAPLQIEPGTTLSLRSGVRINATVSGGGTLGDGFGQPMNIAVGPKARFSGIRVAANPVLLEDNATLVIDGGLSLGGTIHLVGRNATLVAAGTQTWSSGTVAFESPAAAGDPGAAIVLRDGPGDGSAAGSPGVLTLNGTTVHGGRGAVTADPANMLPASLVNGGKISADVAGTELLIDVAGFSNTRSGPNGVVNGTVEAVQGGTLRLAAAPRDYEPATGTLRAGNWTAGVNSSLLFPDGVNIRTNAANVTLAGEGAVAGRFPALAALGGNSGSLTLNDGYDLTVASADASLINSGLLALSDRSAVTVPGNFAQTAAGTLQTGIGGPPANGQYGVVHVGGAATLGGTLGPTMTNGYRAAVTDAYRTLSAASVSKQFDVVLPTNPQGVGNQFVARYDATGVTLAATPPTASAPNLVAQSDTGISSTDDITSDTTPTVDVRAPGSARVKVMVDGVPVAEGVPDGNGLVTFTLGPLDDGRHQLAAIAVDAEGDEAPALFVLNLVVDTTAPALTRAFFRPGGLDKASASSGFAFVFDEVVAGFANTDVDAVAVPSGTSYSLETFFAWSNPPTHTAIYGIHSERMPGGTYRATLKPAAIKDLAGNLLAAGADVEFSIPSAASVAGRYVFYNNSRFDSGTVSSLEADDQAIATDKRALRPGETSTFDNVTSYSRGINGIMADLTAFPAALATVADFEFKIGNGDPAAWAAAPVPTSFVVRPGAGVNGSDRVTIVWRDGAIRNTWLRVTVKPTSRTGLASADVFYFGNLVGETGNARAPGRVDMLDLAGARAATTAGPVDADNRFDFNRDGRINALDLAAARTNLGRTLRPISPPAAASVASVAQWAAAPDPEGFLSTRRVWDEQQPGPLG